METGRYSDPSRMEDFFACTLVVENLDSIARAEKLIRSKFKLHERRPKSDKFTSKSSDSFVFDDLRLYVMWKDDPASRPTGLHGLLFEVQIKTFLQHAWSIATHDLIYKSDEKSWPKERVAFQIKAMLEHADTSILEVEKLAPSRSLKKIDKLTERISKIIELVNQLWPEDLLPHDKKRLAENIENLISRIGIDPQALKNILVTETSSGKGTQTLNLSPYAIVIQSLLNQEPDIMRDFLLEPEMKFKVYLCREIDIPRCITREQLRNAVPALND